MKKLIVKDGCIGCGACVAIDSEHFDFDDTGLSSVISNENLETDELQNAINSCPVNIIKIEEEKCKCNCDTNCNCEGDCSCEGECKEKCNCTEESSCGCKCHCNKE